MNSQSLWPYASSRPGQVLLDPQFWRGRQSRFLLRVGVFLASLLALCSVGVMPVGLLMHGELSWADSLSVVVQVFIFGIGAWAVVQAATILCRLTVESDIASYIFNRGEEVVRGVRSGTTVPISIEQVPDLWPSSPVSELITLRICQAIHVDGQDRQFGSREVLIDSARSDAWGLTRQLRGAPKSALHWGILGTFLGLFLPIPELVKFGQGTFDASAFEGLFDALKSCFATSVCGLLVSLVISGILGYADRAVERYIGVLEQAAITTSVIVRNAVNRNPTARTLDEIGTSLDDLAKRMVAQNERVRLQTETIEAGLKWLQLAGVDLEGFLRGEGQVRESLVKEFQLLAEEFSPAKFHLLMGEELKRTAEGLGKELGQQVGQALKVLETSAHALTAAKDSLDESRNSLHDGRMRSYVDVLRG